MANQKKMEARPTASKEEVLTALMQNDLTSLLLKKRVTLQMAEEVLDSAKLFLKKDDADVPDDDPRIKGLFRYITKERKRNDTALPTPRRIGQTVRYRAQANKQRKTRYVLVPLATIERDGDSLDYVSIHFASNNEIIIKRSK